jgi:hypothetical protein
MTHLLGTQLEDGHFDQDKSSLRSQDTGSGGLLSGGDMG